jgi:hypothetical protein
MATPSVTSPERMALGYTLKILALAMPLAYLVAAAIAVLVGPLVRWDFPLALLVAAFPTVASALVVGIQTYRVYRNLLDPRYEGSSSVDQARHLTVYLPYPSAFQLCLDSLGVFQSYRLLLADQAQGRIEVALVPEPFFKSLFSSSGLRISFRLGSDRGDITYVTVASKSPQATAKVDFGFNKKNVSLILDFFESRGVRMHGQ